MDIVPGLHTARKMPGWHDQHSGLVGSQLQYAAPISLIANNWACKFQDGRTSMEIFEDMVTPRPRYYLGELVLWKIRQYQA